MAENTEDIKREIEKLESEMLNGDFWSDKTKAQATIKKIAELKGELSGAGKYDKGNCILSVLSGAGGDDAEDFSAMLVRMYTKYFTNRGWGWSVIHENKNDLGGYLNISIEVIGKNSYGMLKNESGVHRLVRISPFNAKSLRHTSFSLVEVIPEFEKNSNVIELKPDDIRVELSKSGGPGGQNVNKRETAVRVVHLPTNLSVHVTSERSQEQNKEKALEMLKGKLYKKMEEDTNYDAIVVGGGISYKLSDRLYLRTEVRDFISAFPTDVIAPPPGVTYGKVLQDIVPMVGISYVF